MFKHERTGKVYYSVREKINYYNKIVKGKIEVPASTKRKAKIRLKSLNKLNNRTYEEPTLIMTDDKHFGNSIHKSRIGIVIDKDNKDRVLVKPLHKRTTKSLILSNYPDRQLDEKKRLD
jgi:hypothetical protein